MNNYSDPTISVTQPHEQDMRPAVLVVLITGVLMIALMAFQWYSLNSKQREIAATKIRVTDLQSEITQNQSNIINIQNHATLASTVSGLFAEQTRWEEVLRKVEAQLYKRMRVVNYSLQKDGTVLMSGVTPNFTDYAKVYEAFTNAKSKEVFSEVRVVSVTKGGAEKAQSAENTTPAAPGEIAFSFSLVLNQEILQDSTTNALNE